MVFLRSRPFVTSLIVLLLAALNAAVVYALVVPDARMLRVSFLDVGQGDAILITGPTGVDVLIDGGRDRSVVRELPQVMGPVDRTIDLMIATHPDADHIGGLPEVLSRYEIAYYLAPGIERSTSQAERLDAALLVEGAERLLARRGQRIHLGGGAYADVLYPDRDVSDDDPNAGSVVLRVVYGETSFLLSGDAPDTVEEYLVFLDGSGLESDVLKAGHHGSRSSTSSGWLRTVSPAAVVVSAGEGNSYGHPHAEVLARVRSEGAELVSTIDLGTITYESDGREVRKK